ncbi:hypothetical protein ABZS29_38470 [Kribbella sp. NPDC005582]|uniref:hypothetical protein n=1 Tax=Kribbella sp. NPDC005582 TaxID=3156893 RepID=UPI0033B5B084
MVGRFNVRGGPGETSWEVWDNSVNGQRGSGLTEAAAYELAADLELQYDAYGQRSPAHVRKMDSPVPVEVQTWTGAGSLEAWLYDPKAGQWFGRVRNGVRIEWIPASELRQAGRV